MYLNNIPQENLLVYWDLKTHRKPETLLGRRVPFLVREDGVVFRLVTEELTRQNGGGVCDLLNRGDARPAAPRSIYRGWWDQFISCGIRGACVLQIHGNRACK